MAGLFVSGGDEPSVGFAGRILKRSAYAAFCEAEELIAEAQRAAAGIVATAEEARQAAIREGMAEGRRAGQLEMAGRLAQNAAELELYLSRVEGQLVGVVMKALGRVVEVLDDTTLIVGAVRNALDALRGGNRIVLRVSQAQVQAVKGRVDEILAGFPDLAIVEVVADPRLDRRDSILETEAGFITASIDIHVEAVASAFARRLGREGV